MVYRQAVHIVPLAAQVYHGLQPAVASRCSANGSPEAIQGATEGHESNLLRSPDNIAVIMLAQLLTSCRPRCWPRMIFRQRRRMATKSRGGCSPYLLDMDAILESH